MRELLGTPKAMNAKTELEIINVNAKKVHGCACDNSSKMGNQQPSLFEGDKTCNKCGCVKHISDGYLERKNKKYTSGSQFYSLIVKQNFPDKYQLLCYNCNMGRARNNGICPHWEGSTAIPQGSSSKRSEALISVVTDEDMVSSLSKDKAA